jgi:hypothetical protein
MRSTAVRCDRVSDVSSAWPSKVSKRSPLVALLAFRARVQVESWQELREKGERVLLSAQGMAPPTVPERVWLMLCVLPFCRSMDRQVLKRTDGR